MDDSLWPLLQVRLEHTHTDAQVEEYLAARSRYLARGEPHLPVLDTRALHLPTARQRQLYIDWLREHGPLLRERTLGTAYIVISPAVRMMVSLIRHFGSLHTPYVVVANPIDAAAWAVQRFLEAGLAAPAALLRRYFSLPTEPARLHSPSHPPACLPGG